MRRFSARTVLAMLGAAVVATVLVQAGSASAPSSGNKLFDACLSYNGVPDCTAPPTTKLGSDTQLPGGSEPTLSFTLWNDQGSGSSLTIGSLQLQAPNGFTIDPASIRPSFGTPAAVTGSSFELLNLNLAAGGTPVKVTFSASTPIPCSGSNLMWKVIAKQSNNFSGPPGNDFAQNFSTGLTSQIQAGCHLAWVNQPASALQSTRAQAFPITSVPYDTTGPSVQVEALGADDSLVTSATGAVTLNPTAGSLFPSGSTNLSSAFAGVTADLNGGVATFTGFEGTQTGTGFTVVASANGYTDSPASSQFNISAGENCVTTGGNCSAFTTQLDGSTQVTSSGTGGAFTFMAIDPLTSIPTDVTDSGGGCGNILNANIGGGVVNETDGRTSDTAGTVTFVYALAKSLIQSVPNNGNPFIPICAGLQVLHNGVAVSCDDTSVSQAGWLGESLNPDGTFSGTLVPAQCQDGFWWGILGTQQDAVPAGSPQETAWQGGSKYRYFTISVPSPWDVRFGSP